MFLIIKNNIQTILKETGLQENLSDEFKKDSYSKWRNLTNDLLKDSKSYHKFKTFLFSIQVIVAGSSVLIAQVSKNIDNTSITFSIWIVYALLLILLNYIYRKFPDDYEKLAKDIKIIKLIGVSERLAAKLALFERLSEQDIMDDRETIEQVSLRIIDYEAMNSPMKSVIDKCINPNSRFTSSRDTNVTFSKDDYELIDDEKIKLSEITREINETSQILFGGRGYSAKLYLRVIKNINDKDKVEMLVPFSRFPTKENYGSSWIKSRGNLSAVWECLEKGKEQVVDFSEQDLYYKSILAICLPGRIGVLTIQNEDNDIFDKNYSELDCKALALVTKQLTLDALAIKN